jgi:hypothetical protein
MGRITMEAWITWHDTACLVAAKPKIPVCGRRRSGGGMEKKKEDRAECKCTGEQARSRDQFSAVVCC